MWKQSFFVVVVKSDSYRARPLFEIVNWFANLNWHISDILVQRLFILIFTSKREKKFDIFPLHTATNIEKIPAVLKGNSWLSSTVYSINTAVLDQVLFALSSQITLHTKYQSFFSLYEKWRQRLFGFVQLLKSKRHVCIYLQTVNNGLLIKILLVKTIYFMQEKCCQFKTFFAWNRWFINKEVKFALL